MLTDFWAVLGNSTLWESFAHTVLAALRDRGASWCSGSAAGEAWLETTRRDRLPASGPACAAAFAAGSRAVTSVTGDTQARLMDSQQPMKMAAAEAVYRHQQRRQFLLLTIGNLYGQPIFQIRIPHLLA